MMRRWQPKKKNMTDPLRNYLEREKAILSNCVKVPVNPEKPSQDRGTFMKGLSGNVFLTADSPHKHQRKNMAKRKTKQHLQRQKT